MQLQPVKLVHLVLLISTQVPTSHADFGDYVDDTFECPALTTCPVVCAENTNQCRTRCGPGENLCIDGSCQELCPIGLESPCPDCAPFACAKEIEYYDDCISKYSEEYDRQNECLEREEIEDSTFTTGPLTFFASWFIGVAFCTFLWTGFTNRPGPAGKDHTTKVIDEKTGETVTGYRNDAFGLILLVANIITLVGFQLLLLMLCIQSYQGNSEVVLAHFEVVWMLGIVYTFLFKWPYSIRSVFYKRCVLSSAEIVCTVSPSTKIEEKNTLSKLASVFNSVMSTLFSVPNSNGGKVEYHPVKKDERHGTMYFIDHFRRYNYDSEKEVFQPGSLKVINTIGDVVDSHEGLSTKEVQRRLRIVGPNTIEMHKPDVLTTMSTEFSKPFYIYQLFILWTWMPLNFYYMAIVHGTCVIVGGMTTAFFRYRNECNLFKLSHISGEVTCKRDGRLVSVQQVDLVPGDLVNVNDGMVYSDMVLVSTEGLLLDESALTGESTPMAKTAVDPTERDAEYSFSLHKKHTVMAGTTVIEAEKDQNMAVVLTTGSYTSKGELLRDIFKYERASFDFDAEIPYVFIILLIESIIGFFLIGHFIQEQPVFAWFYGMYVVSTLLPPLLPTVFTVSVGMSDNRLSRKRIACSNSEEILVAGRVNRAFFDKTGTLTRQGLDFISAKCRNTWLTNDAELSSDLVMGMSCCHHLTQSSKGEIIGNAVDRVMLESSGATLVSTSGTVDRIKDKYGNPVDILKHFDFDHHRMTQSVIVKRPDGRKVCFVKGSGESVQKLCNPVTLPPNFSDAVKDSAKSGIYQISMAMKTIPEDTDFSTLTRDEVETDLSFVGVLNFKNVLRDETPGVILHLESGGVQCIMVTGDSVHTGITIAKECGMIKEGVRVLLCSRVDADGSLTWVNAANEEAADLPTFDELGLGSSTVELAVTGEVWAHLCKRDQREAASLARAIRVYGRCTPHTKVSVITTFVEMGFVTLMCGDGGNDCGALKTAHVGVALSDAEASIVSPFTSLDKTITSVIEILLEGRCALASALASYKYIIMYGHIEAFDNLVMANFHINFSEYCWTFMDGIWMVGMGFTLPLSKAAKSLAPSWPTSSLLGYQTVSSVVGVLAINVSFAFIALFILFQQDWFQCRKWGSTDVSNVMVIGDNYEASVLFVVVGFQYISSAMAYNFGYEFRQGWFRNTFFVFLVVLFSTLHYWATLVPGKLSCFWRLNCENDDVVYMIFSGGKIPIQNPFNTTLMPMDFRVILVVIITVNAACNMMWDYCFVNGLRKRAIVQKQQESTRLIPAKYDGSSELTLAETI